MDQQQVAPAVAEPPKMRLGNVAGWFLLLVGATAIAQQGALRDLNGLLFATVTVAIFYAVGALGGLIFYRLRGRPYSHFAGLATASVFVGLLLLGAASRNPSSTVSAPGADPSAAIETEWAAAYTRFFEDPSKRYLQGPAIKAIFDKRAATAVGAGMPAWQALSDAQAFSNDHLEASVPPVFWVRISETERYAPLYKPQHYAVFKHRARERLAAGDPTNWALITAAEMALTDIGQAD